MFKIKGCELLEGWGLINFWYDRLIKINIIVRFCKILEF